MILKQFAQCYGSLGLYMSGENTSNFVPWNETVAMSCEQSSSSLSSIPSASSMTDKGPRTTDKLTYGYEDDAIFFKQKDDVYSGAVFLDNFQSYCLLIDHCFLLIKFNVRHSP